jgi:short-subunit dehydrogenase
MSTQDYKGRALITGASTGIGAVYADRLARRGYDLVLVARDTARLDAQAQRLVRETGRKVETMAADLTVKADLQRVEERLHSDRSITALVNSAGVGASLPLVDSDPDSLEAMIQINVTALTRLVRAAAPGFVSRGQGVIINIGSSMSLWPEMLNGTYNGTKAFVVNFTQSLHNEIGGKGVQVQAVLPGAIHTEFWERHGVAVANFPKAIVMTAEDLVDAALAGLDQHELVTIPSLPNVADWDAFNAARKALTPNLSRAQVADRYKKKANAAG